MTYDEFLKEACPGLDMVWRKYRKRAARHRLDARLKELGMERYDQYLDLVRREPVEAAGLPDLMRVTMTRFFREQKAWQELTEEIFPLLMASKGDWLRSKRSLPVPVASPTSVATTLRAWSAGCCGGEEPYSLALCWLNYLQPSHPEWSISITATDIDDASLDRARAGIYSIQSLREVPPELRTRWFRREDSLWRISPEATALVTLQKSNLLLDAPPQNVDLVLCRYLAFTYYKGERLLAAVRKVWASLRARGVLMIGRKESLPEAAGELFEPVRDSRIFYQKKG
jgi:chemotaxis protein methyltransferase CheR